MIGFALRLFLYHIIGRLLTCNFGFFFAPVRFSCGKNNFARRDQCFQCQAPRPAGAGGAPEGGAMPGGMGSSRPGDWDCAVCLQVWCHVAAHYVVVFFYCW